jgi:hypothetical protein
MGNRPYYRRRRYKRNIDPDKAHHYAVNAARARTGNDYHIRKLTEAATTLTGEQKQRLATLLAERDLAGREDDTQNATSSF